MKIKRFVGSSIQEVMRKVKRELGSDAVILHTRNIKQPGLLGFFKKKSVEVIVAIEGTESYPAKDFNDFSITLKEENRADFIRRDKDFSEPRYMHQIEDEIKKIRNMVESVVNTLDTKKAQLPDELSIYFDCLIRNGVNEEVAFQILNTINQQINISNKDSSKIKEIVSYSIKDFLGEPSPINYNGMQKVIFFIGPTGVGKTTTLAKIAANLSIDQRYSVGIITADTYRIAAVEQIKVYCEIMNIPLKVVYEIEDIYKSLSNFRDKDIILVDTAGRNHKNQEQMEELKELIEAVNNKEIHLVISVTTNFETIKDILDSYSFITDYKLIFSKVDEANNLGNILNVKYYFNKNMSYLTTGQNVPDDIEVPNIEKLSEFLIGESSYA